MLFLCLMYNRLVTVRCPIVEYNNHVQFIILSDSGYMRDQMPTNLSNLRSKNIVTDTKRFFINLCMSFETVKRHFYQPCPILGYRRFVTIRELHDKVSYRYTCYGSLCSSFMIPQAVYFSSGPYPVKYWISNT